MSELQRLKSLLPPENESWVFVEAAAAIDPPLITLEEIGREDINKYNMYIRFTCTPENTISYQPS